MLRHSIFLERSFAPLLRRLGPGLNLELRRHGFYPAGGGEMAATITPSALQPFDLLERGPLLNSYAECLIPALPRSVATRELTLLGQALGWSEAQLLIPAVRQNEAAAADAELMDLFWKPLAGRPDVVGRTHEPRHRSSSRDRSYRSA